MSSFQIKSRIKQSWRQTSTWFQIWSLNRDGSALNTSKNVQNHQWWKMRYHIYDWSLSCLLFIKTRQFCWANLFEGGVDVLACCVSLWVTGNILLSTPGGYHTFWSMAAFDAALAVWPRLYLVKSSLLVGRGCSVSTIKSFSLTARTGLMLMYLFRGCLIFCCLNIWIKMKTYEIKKSVFCDLK